MSGASEAVSSMAASAIAFMHLLLAADYHWSIGGQNRGTPQRYLAEMPAFSSRMSFKA
jgi:hypothetical protein